MRLFIITAALWALAIGSSAASFDQHFEPRTMRIDYTHGGNAESEQFYFNRTLREGEWAGSRTNMVDTTALGNHLFKGIDKSSGEVIYSRGYCSLFNEWQCTPEALHTSKSYLEAIIFPYPKAPIRVEFYSRNRVNNNFVKYFEMDVDPASYQIVKQKPLGEAFDVQVNGAVANSIDIVLLGEGYSTDERQKFEQDCNTFALALFAYTPFKERQAQFNIRAVWCGDGFDSDISAPGEDEWRTTPLGTKFYTFDSERYQMADDFQCVRNYAATAPYDYIYILSNTTKYGGGGIFNMYAIATTDHPKTELVYVHEMAHLLVGLGDEYVEESSEIYNLAIEPWVLNLTTLKNFDSKPWSAMIDSSTPIPTPITKLNESLLGVYEGGGYMDKGVYRPWINCIMNNLHKAEIFCPVCTKAMDNYIDYLIK